jgi:N-acetylglucosaminyldiphosphoundecaprenol N-acetyl-beta-D-mannosaminyltransferase
MMPAANPARPFGLSFSTASAGDIASMAVMESRSSSEGVALVVTPNIDHIAWLRRSPAMARAYAGAAVTVCDGWPVQFYARVRGLPVNRVTGCEIASMIMRTDLDVSRHRLFFVVDRAETEASLREWARARGFADIVGAAIPPFGFEDDDAMCRETFVDQYQAWLPPCWAFCVGQAIKIELGLVARAPRAWQASGMEWMWRVAQEPRRLAGRYIRSSVAFLAAVVEDLWRSHTQRRPAEGKSHLAEGNRP